MSKSDIPARKRARAGREQLLAGEQGSHAKAVATHLLLGVTALALLTFVCFRLKLDLATTAFLYLIAIVLLSLQGSFLVSAVLSFIAVGCLAYYFAPPIFSFRVDDARGETVATIVFLTSSAVITRGVEACPDNLRAPRNTGGSA